MKHLHLARPTRTEVLQRIRSRTPSSEPVPSAAELVRVERDAR